MDQTAQLVAAVSALFGALQIAWGVYTAELRKSRDECCRKADAHEKANADRLAAFERRDSEERAWRLQQERDGARGRAAG